MTTDSLVDNLRYDAVAAEPTALSRWQVIWRARFAIAGVALVIAVATWAVGSYLPKSYQASSEVLIGGRAAAATVDSVNGMNNLAAQYTQLAMTAPVLDAAAKVAGGSAGDLAAATTVATVGNTNIVRVTVVARSAGKATQRAQAITSALAAFVVALRASDDKVQEERLKEIDALLAQAKSDVTAARNALLSSPAGSAAAQSAGVTLNNASQQVTSFTLKRVDLINQATNERTAHDVSLTVLTPGSGAAQTGPRPFRYAIVALVLGLVLFAEFAVFSERRRNPVVRARRHRPVLFG